MSALNDIQIAKRVIAAEGFLELGLPKLALTSLAEVEAAGDMAEVVDCLRCLAVIAVDGVPIETDLLRDNFRSEMTDCYRRAGWRRKRRSGQVAR